MSNVLQFYIQLKDMMSSGLIKIASTAKSTGKDIAGVFSKVQDEVGAATKKNNEFSRSLEQIDKKGQSAGMSLRSLAVAAGITLSASTAFAGIKEALQQSAMAENQKIAFKVMLGNPKDGEDMYNNIRKMADTTPFQSQDLMRSGKMLLGFGEDKKKIMPDLKMLGDVASAQDDPTQALAGLSHAYGEAMASGRLLGRNTLELINWGFNPLKEISIMTGKSMEDLKKEEEKGAISADILRASFAHATSEGGRFNNMMEQQSQTLGGKWTTFMDMTNGMMRNLGDSLSPAAKGLMDATMKLFSPNLFKSPLAGFTEQSEKIRLLQIQLTSLNTTESQRKTILDELTSINPNITQGINAQAIEYGKLANNINNVIDALYNKKIADEFDLKNVGKVTDYQKSMTDQRDYFLEMQKIEAKYNLPFLDNPNLSTGNKQIMFQNYLKQHAKGSALSGTVNGESLDLSAYQYALRSLNTAVDVQKSLAPEIAKIQGEKSKALAAYHKYYGGAAAVIKPSDSNIPNTQRKGEDAGESETGRSITSGGKQPINIHIGKMVERIDIHSATTNEGLDNMEERVKELFMRLLYSGSKMQS